MRVVGYLRVSTDRQDEEGLGLELQEQEIRSWADINGHTLVTLTRDEGQSGFNGIDTRIGTC
jgi:DNA invertase Pin-like site-specific DNA recombinase